MGKSKWELDPWKKNHSVSLKCLKKIFPFTIEILSFGGFNLKIRIPEDMVHKIGEKI